MRDKLKRKAREIAHRHCICSDSAYDPKVMINHSNLCDEITAAVLEAWSIRKPYVRRTKTQKTDST